MNNGDEIQPMTPFPRVERHGLAPDGQRDGDFPVSRDWKHVDCQATGCEYNRLRSCAVPSIANIGEDGRCTGFTPKPLPKQIDGD